MAAPDILALNDIIEVTHFARNNATSCEVINRHWMLCTNVPATPTSDLSAVAVQMEALWETNFKPAYPQEYNYLRCVAKKLTSVARGIPTPSKPHPVVLTFLSAAEFETSWVGVNPGQALAAVQTVSIFYRPVLVGRYWRGGVHIGPVAESSVQATDRNKLTPGASTFFDTAFTNYRAPVLLAGGSTVQVYMFSPTYYAWPLGAVGPLSAATAPVYKSSVNLYVRTQLTRQPPHVP